MTNNEKGTRRLVQEDHKTVEKNRRKRQTKPTHYEHFDVELMKIMTKHLSENSKSLTKEILCELKARCRDIRNQRQQKKIETEQDTK